ncbi:DUF6694 family lipoprotein [Xenorhabdus griffiniae]|uniref:Lipoprotein n=1 Tax=Xenorhabdus griffiniae TaxID=351672 RepID=A0ABY9XK24_9GAMM|nr:DUF6694 family lipoprotein [Xenorhabdus griffiniae]MBD1226610.1 hypothetical protein [Xenorhabdus griffiniae]MBE8587508.1 hypothetical protein [Xenorhabdus griffiniae]WMV73251.1 hypothetical protein QL128_04215 [Xenorhabdus griffiniae]WNH02930.1 hypothetical protein QL112_004220 [Xenorhabdus griffiniae]
MKKLLTICLLGFALAGCDNQLKIDGTNEIAVKTSIEKIRDTLPEDKKLQFDDSLNVVMMHSLDFDELFKEYKNGNIKHADIQKLEQKFFQTLNGKTADQVIEEAEKIKADSMNKK